MSYSPYKTYSPAKLVMLVNRLAQHMPREEAEEVFSKLAYAEDVKPSLIMCAIREARVSVEGMPETCWGTHRRVVRWYTLVGERCVLVYGAPWEPMRKVYNEKG